MFFILKTKIVCFAHHDIWSRELDNYYKQHQSQNYRNSPAQYGETNVTCNKERQNKKSFKSITKLTNIHIKTTQLNWSYAGQVAREDTK